MEELPQDIFFSNIFTRLPVKSLLQYRSVSKPWQTTIDDPLLPNTHLEFSTKKSNLVIIMQHRKSELTRFYLVKDDSPTRTMESKLISTIPMSRNSLLKCSCNGLLCFVNCRYSSNYEIFVCNPFLNQVVMTTTSLGTSRRHIFGLGYSPLSKEYKLVQVERTPTLHTRIYSLKTKVWRDIVSKPAYPLLQRPVYTNGALHWKIDTNSGDFKTEHHIVSFDMETEEFEIIDHPKLGFEKNNLIDVIELEGNLCLVDYSSSMCIDIWMLKDWGKKKWVKEYSITVRRDNGDASVVGFWGCGKIFFTLNDNYMSYDSNDGQIECHTVQKLDPDFTVSEVFGYTGSLVSPKDLLDHEKR
ncbi:hypothetical protein ACHQM5_024059 [Ranunculus cassubicifolius]